MRLLACATIISLAGTTSDDTSAHDHDDRLQPPHHLRASTLSPPALLPASRLAAHRRPLHPPPALNTATVPMPHPRHCHLSFAMLLPVLRHIAAVLPDAAPPGPKRF
ncbi:hypothetical protein B0H13DRAFT_2302202 [Mycena leptocephala]|nr:hypothetical protein B0H13DRAFT_2302202 [Mycena leptocephala]